MREAAPNLTALGSNAHRKLPSLKRDPPKLCGRTCPFLSFAIRTTGFRIPGTAADAMMADQMMQFGAVRWLSRIVGLAGQRDNSLCTAHPEMITDEWRSDGTTDTFNARPVLS
jgi:hypothetical protein